MTAPRDLYRHAQQGALSRSADGLCRVPHALLRAFVGARYLMDRQPPSLQQTVVAEFMRQGHFASHLRRTRLQYRDQRDALATEFTPASRWPSAG